jgi:hypothetical protein
MSFLTAFDFSQDPNSNICNPSPTCFSFSSKDIFIQVFPFPHNAKVTFSVPSQYLDSSSFNVDSFGGSVPIHSGRQFPISRLKIGMSVDRYFGKTCCKMEILEGLEEELVAQVSSITST